MTQPAKVQEPSMEEILASIRRIIADDETKASDQAAQAAPAVKPASPSAPVAIKPAPAATVAPAASRDEHAAPKPVAAKPAAPGPAAPEPDAAQAASNSQDDIDALLAGFDTPATTPDAVPAAADDDVFDLTDEMALPDMPQVSFDPPEPDNDLEFSEVAKVAEHHQPSPERPHARASGGFENLAAPQMLSHSTVSAVESAFNSLANTVLSNNARTLEDLVREMLRPMLKSWLDDNLPGLVERIVKAEIERVSRGR